MIAAIYLLHERSVGEVAAKLTPGELDLLALSDVCRPALASHCHTFGQPRRRLRLHPIQSFETGLKFVHWLNCAIGPFGLYFPMLAIFKNHTKYRSSRRHVFTYMMARRE